MARTLAPRVQVVLEGIALGAFEMLYALQRPGILAFGGWPSDLREWSRRIERLEEQGSLASEPCGDRRTLRLTAHGREILNGGRIPAEQWCRVWDGWWRLAVFDVTETRREIRRQLCRVLKQHGFGRLQDSVWISPHPQDAIAAALADLAPDPGSLLFLESKPAAGESDASIVASTWDFERLNRSYGEVQRCHEMFPEAGASAATLQAWLEAERQLWMAALRCDPLLPCALHPVGYLGPATATARSIHIRTAWERLKTLA